ncbi:cell division protein FtsZ, partial [Bacillus cereus]|nr:cell division protein FtsZ [Bacillus cereus]
SASTQPPKPIIRPTANHTQQQQQPVDQDTKQREVKREMKREEQVMHDRHTDSDDIDIQAFLRNRRRR